MARIRSVKPEFWTSEQVMDVSRDARILFIGMWNFCDDAGIHSANEKRLKAEVFPADDLTSSDVRRMVDELLRAGLLAEYEVGGQRFWIVTGWHHQKIDQPTFKHPGPDGRVPDGAPRRRQARMKTKHSPDVRGMAGEPSASEREVFDEHTANARREHDERSLPEWRGGDGKGIVNAGGNFVAMDPQGARFGDDYVPSHETEWAAFFGSEHGVAIAVSSLHDRKKFMPLAAAWVNAKVSVRRMRDAIAKAQAEATESIAYLPAYVDRVLASLAAPRASPRWADTEAILAGLTGNASRQNHDHDTIDVDAHLVD